MIQHLWTNSLPRAETELMTKFFDFFLEKIILNTFLQATRFVSTCPGFLFAVLLPANNKAQSVYIAWMQSISQIYYPQTFCPVLCRSLICRHRGLYSLFSWRKICRNRVSQ